LATPNPTEVEALLRLAHDRSLQGRKRLAAAMGDLFFASNVELSAQERALMTDILRKLIRDSVQPVRRILAEKLASAPNAPREILIELANDDFQVAEAILLKSPALHDTDLIEIIYHRTLQHQLAIAMRRGLSEIVSDALVDSGQADVIRTLLENQDARISQPTMAYLVDQSKTVDSFQEPILRRRDLPPALAKKMYLWVSAALRHHIVRKFPVDVTQLDEMVEAAAHQAMTEGEREQAGTDAPGDVVRRLAEAGQMTPHFMVRCLRQGEIPLFEAAFAELTGLRPTLIRRLLFEPDAEGLAVSCRAIDMDKPTFASIYLLSRRARPSGRVTRPQDLSDLLDWFDRVDPTAARAVLARWRRDPDLLFALKTTEETASGATPA